jgi:hypothetical protein
MGGCRALIAFDAEADAVQVEVKGGELGVGFDDFPDPPRVEDERIFSCEAGAALAAQFAPKITALQGRRRMAV